MDREGVYLGLDGNEYDVVNVNKHGNAYFRAYYNGGWYNVNIQPGNEPFDVVELEVIAYLRPLNIDTRGCM